MGEGGSTGDLGAGMCAGRGSTGASMRGSGDMEMRWGVLSRSEGSGVDAGDGVVVVDLHIFTLEGLALWWVLSTIHLRL